MCAVLGHRWQLPALFPVAFSQLLMAGAECALCCVLEVCVQQELLAPPAAKLGVGYRL